MAPSPVSRVLSRIGGSAAGRTVRNARDAALGLVPVTRAGVLGIIPPGQLVDVGRSWVRWDLTPGGLISIAAARAGGRTAIIDDAGEVTYADFEERTLRLARALRHGGIRPRARIGILARNHRHLLYTIGASSRIGTDLVLLNTGASSAQLLAVIAEQRLDQLFIDEEFTSLLPDGFAACPVSLSWMEDPADESAIRPGWTSIQRMLDTAPPEEVPTAALPSRPRRGRTIILTSGTTGTPKGARRTEPRTWMPAASIMSRIPLRQSTVVHIAAPIFHTWGYANLQLALSLRNTVLLRRHFEPEATRDLVEARGVHTMVVVPTMLLRMTELPAENRAQDVSSLRVIASSGSVIPRAVVEATLEQFGPVLYNLYGSTEVSWASIATPEELAADPTTAGRPPLGTRLLIVDDDGRPVPRGTVGRIFVANNMLFEGYTRPGTDKEVIDGMFSTGDLGLIDSDGEIFIAGRADDMIVSGGENVYPRETEDLLSELAGVREAAVVGAPDDRYGQRLVAFVVRTGDADGDALTEDGVKAFVKENLARHSVPRDVIWLPRLPRNAVGKVVPRELPDPVVALAAQRAAAN